MGGWAARMMGMWIGGLFVTTSVQLKEIAGVIQHQNKNKISQDKNSENEIKLQQQKCTDFYLRLELSTWPFPSFGSVFGTTGERTET